MTDEEIDKLLANFTRSDYEARQDLLKPYMDDLMALKDDTSIIENAQTQVDRMGPAAQAQLQRQQSRYGVSPQSGAVQRATNSAAELGLARATENIANNAIQAQETANYNALGDYLGYGRRRQTSALQGLGDFNMDAANRNAAYQNALTSNNASNMSMVLGGATALGGALALGI